MDFVKIPNCPQTEGGIFLCPSVYFYQYRKILQMHNMVPLYTCVYPGVYKAVSRHGDIFIHYAGDGDIVVAPSTCKFLLDKLAALKMTIYIGNTEPAPGYPFTAAYNVARVGNFAFCNEKFTDKVLLNLLDSKNVKIVNVKQGYTKCSTAVINENAIITADIVIAKKADTLGIDVLLLKQDKSVQLPGLDFGFIGGAVFLISKTKIMIFGQIGQFPQRMEILNFFDRYKLDLINVFEGRITDVGGIQKIIEF